MSGKRWVLVGVLGWVATVTVVHLALNLHAFSGSRFRVGFLPVT